jgi:hypothetical protein
LALARLALNDLVERGIVVETNSRYSLAPIGPDHSILAGHHMTYMRGGYFMRTREIRQPGTTYSSHRIEPFGFKENSRDEPRDAGTPLSGIKSL